MDLAISRWFFEAFGSSKFVGVLLKIMTILGSKWVILGTLLVLAIFKKNRKMCLYAFIAIGSCYVLNDFILKYIFKRPRPFMIDGELAKMSELAHLELPDGYSMPSGHSALTMALAVSFMLHSKKYGIPAIIYSVLVGLSRIILCVHFFTDVLVGFILGVVISIGVYYTCNFLFSYVKRRISNEKSNTGNEKQT